MMRVRWPKLADFIINSESDDLPEPAPNQAAPTISLERLNKEVKRRADIVSIFPNEASIVIGAVLLEANDD